jgi:hypothetical protein
MQKYFSNTILSLSTIVVFATASIIILNVWLLPIIYSGQKNGYVFYPVLICVVVLVSWLVYGKLPMDSFFQKIFLSLVSGIFVAIIVLIFSLAVILNTIGS